MVQLHVERTIAASPERVFDWLADPTPGRFSFGSPRGRLGVGGAARLPGSNIPVIG
jgi:uncharacterized protein YndB with AHSA1/START domain